MNNLHKVKKYAKAAVPSTKPDFLRSDLAGLINDQLMAIKLIKVDRFLIIFIVISMIVFAVQDQGFFFNKKIF